MKFSKLTIRNFRSFDGKGSDILFADDRNLATLIGPNGAGKSNVLTALGIVLGVPPFSRFEPGVEDFHDRDADAELLIRLELNPPLKVEDVYRKAHDVVAFQYRVWRKKRGGEEGAFSTEHVCIAADGKALMLPRRIYKKGLSKDTGEVYDNAPWPVHVTDYAWRLGKPFFMHAFDLERFFAKKSGWSPLARLIKIYVEDFQRDDTTCVIEGKTYTTKQAFDRYAELLPQLFRTKKLTEIETNIAERVATYIGNTDSPIRVEFGVPGHEELVRDVLTVMVADRADRQPLPVDRLGDGYRALLRLAIFETLLKLNANETGHILLIEEPESFLHVHLARYFYGVLRELADNGNQIVYSTHAPAFVDLDSADEIVRVSRQGTCSTPRQLPAGTTLDFSSVNKKIRAGNEELLFASTAMLLEGEDDRAAFSVALEKAGIDCNARSISLIDCKSANNLPDYIRLCGALGVDFFAVHDEDDPNDNSQQKRNQRIAKAVKDAGGGAANLHILKPDLEGTLKLSTKIGASKIIELLESLGKAEIAKQYPAFWEAVDKFIARRLPKAKKVEEVAKSKADGPEAAK